MIPLRRPGVKRAAAPAPYVVAFSDRKPETTFPENALIRGVALQGIFGAFVQALDVVAGFERAALVGAL